MSHTFTIQIEPSMLRGAWNAWCFAGGRGWRLVIALLLTFPTLLNSLQSERLSTASIVVLTTACLGLAIFVLAYWLGLRRAQAKSTALVDGKTTYTLTDKTIEVSSALGSIALVWSALAEVRGHGGLVLLGFRGAHYSPLPANQIAPEALAFLIERARSAGAKIAGL
jgi:hypothetical protein